MANVTAANINDTSARGVIQGLLFTADYYDLFEIELWNYDLTTYYYTSSWIDSSSVNNYTYMDFSGLGVGTGYSFKAFSKSGGNRNFIGSYSFYTTSPAPPRPSDWAWSTLVSSANTNPNVTYNGVIPLVIVDASEWNSFTARINAFRSYKGLSTYLFSSVGSGQGFSDSIYQEAVSAISSMATVSQPSGFYSKLVALKDALNSIS